jgi:ATP-dependent Clp protease ATP-binding subunit ClpX
LIVDKKDSFSYATVTSKDIIAFGMIPEFVGRFGIITYVEDLLIKDLVRILKEPKNSLIKQYKKLFELDGIILEFEEDALKIIAEKAKEMQTNARGLKNILETILLPYQFEAIDLVERNLVKILISKKAVTGKPATLIFDEKNKKVNHESNR